MSKCCLNRLSGLMIVLLLSANNYALAQWNPNPAVNTPVCTTAGTNQFQPQLVPDGSGGAYIAWMETPDFNSSQVYAQHLSATGSRLWASPGIPVTAVPGLYSQVHITTDADGGAIVSWINTANAAIHHYVQKISPAGQLQWNSNGVAVCAAAVTQMFFYQLLGDGYGGAILLWDDQRNGPNQIYAQRIGADGSTLWTAAGISCTPPFANISSYEAVADSTGGFIMCWSLTTGVGVRNDIFVQHINGSGVPQWGAQGKNISVAAGDQLYCKIAKDIRDNVIVTWQDFRLDPAWSQLYGQRIAADGTNLWQPGGKILADSVVAASTVSKIASDTTGGVLLAWLDNFLPLPSTTAHLMGVHADSMGTIIATKKEIASWPDLQMPVDFKMVPDFNGGSFISWAQPYSANAVGNGYEIYDVYAQHWLSDSNTEYPVTGQAVSTAPMTQYYQQLVCDSNGVAILAWSDIRNGADFDLYASTLSVQNTLPVTWLTFSGSVVEPGVLLKWATSAALNNRGFFIERSADGIHFNQIGFIAASGTNINSNYTFTDAQPLQGASFYRLKQADIDGKTEYSKTIRVFVQPGNSFSIFPNPATTQLFLQNNVGNATITIYQPDGKIVTSVYSAGAGLKSIDISAYTPGLYIISIVNREGKQAVVRTFIKQ